MFLFIYTKHYFAMWHNFASYALIFVLLFLLLSIFVLSFLPRQNSYRLKMTALICSTIIFFWIFFLWMFSPYIAEGYFVYFYSYIWMIPFNIYYEIALDGISVFFVLLTTFLIPICILVSWNSIVYKLKEFLILLFIIEFLLINVFITLDLFFFYIFFESVLIPMFIMIGVWGSRQRKIHAAYQFFFYTLLGSIIMLMAIIYIYFTLKTTSVQQLVIFCPSFSKTSQLILWTCFFISFAVKVPMVPVHIWLPEAHVEAPTAGSVILAGILLKLGVYGIIRFLIPMFPYAMSYFSPLVCTLCVIGIIYASAVTIRQFDFKKIIAYSSVSHMNFALLGLFTGNSVVGMEGCLFFMLAHGIVSSALFICVGMLYERYHTRNLLYYGGIVQTMPLFSVFFFLFTIANLGLPGLSNFIGEFLVLISVWQYNTVVAFFAGLGLVLASVYSIWFCNRLIFGQIKYYSLQKFKDLTKRELIILCLLLFMVFVMGIFPNIFLNTFHMSLYHLIIY
jgi:NADH-quinone oxidoreductase subunit M